MPWQLAVPLLMKGGVPTPIAQCLQAVWSSQKWWFAFGHWRVMGVSALLQGWPLIPISHGIESQWLQNPMFGPRPCQFLVPSNPLKSAGVKSSVIYIYIFFFFLPTSSDLSKFWWSKMYRNQSYSREDLVIPKFPAKSCHSAGNWPVSARPVLENVNHGCLDQTKIPMHITLNTCRKITFGF